MLYREKFENESYEEYATYLKTIIEKNALTDTKDETISSLLKNNEELINKYDFIVKELDEVKNILEKPVHLGNISDLMAREKELEIAKDQVSKLLTENNSKLDNGEPSKVDGLEMASEKVLNDAKQAIKDLKEDKEEVNEVVQEEIYEEEVDPEAILVTNKEEAKDSLINKAKASILNENVALEKQDEVEENKEMFEDLPEPNLLDDNIEDTQKSNIEDSTLEVPKEEVEKPIFENNNDIPTFEVQANEEPTFDAGVSADDLAESLKEVSTFVQEESLNDKIKENYSNFEEKPKASAMKAYTAILEILSAKEKNLKKISQYASYAEVPESIIESWNKKLLDEENVKNR